MAKKDGASAPEKTDRELLEAALRDLEKAEAFVERLVRALRWSSKKERLSACDEAEAYLGRKVAAGPGTTSSDGEG